MSAPLFLVLVSLVFGIASSEQNFETLYEWTFINYDLPANSYIPQNNLFTGLELSEDRIFLAVPNLRSGIPITLAWLPRPDHPLPIHVGKSPALQPYPSLEWQGTAGNCTGLVSAYRIRVDRCNRLWVMDSGVITTLENYLPVCPPKILVFDLKTDSLVRTIFLPREVLRPHSLMTNLLIDYEIVGTGGGGAIYHGSNTQRQQTCDDAFIYASDSASAAIVVYDVRNDAAWRVFHPSMLPHPDYSTYTIAGESFTLPDSVVGIALSPETGAHKSDIFGYPIYRGQRVLYYQPFAGLRLFSIPTSILQTPQEEDADLQVKIVFEKSSQSASLACDPIDGSVYFNPVSELAIVSLIPGSRRPQIVAKDPEALQFSSDILISPKDNYNMWFVTSKFQKYYRQTYDPNTINFRIMRIRRQPYATYKYPFFF